MNRPLVSPSVLAACLFPLFLSLPACHRTSPGALSAVAPARSGANAELDVRVVTERWFPTGDQATSVLVLRQSMPGEMRVDRENEYTFEVVNRSAHTLPGVSIAAMSFENLEFLGSSPAPTLRQGGQPIWMIGDLLPRESRTITVRARPIDSGTVTTVLSASFSSLLTASVEAVEPRLDLVKTATSTACGSCTDIELDYSVRNVGTGTARGVVVKDLLPEGLRTLDGSREISLDAGDLAGGSGRNFTVVVRADRGGSFASAASATDRNGLVARSAPAGTVVEEPSLSILAVPSHRVVEGSLVTHRFEVANSGPCEVRGAVIRVAIPAGFRLVTASPDASVEPGGVRWNPEAVRPGESIELSLTLRGGGPETTAITAEVEAACLGARAARTEVEVVTVPDGR